MSTYISRRRVVAGAAWAAPVIATSAAVPAFAASLDCVFAESPHKFLRGYSDYRVEEEFTVPANVHRIRFDILVVAESATPATKAARVPARLESLR